MEGARNGNVEVALAVHILHSSKITYVRRKQLQTWRRAKLLCCVQQFSRKRNLYPCNKSCRKL